MQLTFESERLFDEIKHHGYAEFEHNIPTEQIENAVSRYADFTLAHPDPSFETMSAMLPDIDNLPILAKSLDILDPSQDTQKTWHKYRTNIHKVGKPNGYTNRSFQEQALLASRGIQIPYEDPKEFYHFSPSLSADIDLAHAEFGWGKVPPEVYGLNQALLPIHANACQLILKVCTLIEEVHPEIKNIITPNALLHSPIRLLFYHPNEVLQVDDSSQLFQLGAGHYDKAGLTAQLAESHKGLRVAPNDADPLQDVVRDDTKAVVFAGASMRNFFPDTSLKPGWHDIIQTNEVNAGRSVPDKAKSVCGRWAMIFFANSTDFVPPDKTLMHTR